MYRFRWKATSLEFDRIAKERKKRRSDERVQIISTIFFFFFVLALRKMLNNFRWKYTDGYCHLFCCYKLI